MEKFVLEEKKAYLYSENLLGLKDTVYKYSRIWEIFDYLDDEDTYSIAKLTFYSIYYPQFEYLINYGLYNLAWESASCFRSGKNFKDIFGVEKNICHL